MHSPVLGFALVFIAAIAGGALAVPLKKHRKFELENIYVPSTLVMMLILPFLMAAFVAPGWLEALRAAGTRTVWAGSAYGFGWGVGAILFGYGVTLAGMSVGYATIMGINTAVGSILPFLVMSPADLFTAGARNARIGAPYPNASWSARLLSLPALARYTQTLPSAREDQVLGAKGGFGQVWAPRLASRATRLT
jgi:hypothetical protein